MGEQLRRVSVIPYQDLNHHIWRVLVPLVSLVSLVSLAPLIFLPSFVQSNVQVISEFGWSINVIGVAEARSLEPPKLYDTLRALKHPQGVDQALSYLKTLSRAELRAIRVERLQRALIDLACPSDRELTDHEAQQSSHAVTRALRALSLLEKLREITEPLDCLRVQWRRTAQTKRAPPMYGQRHADLIARRASGVLSRLGRVDLLNGATKHPDPEVRANAASAGADPRALCALKDDRWPLVKRAASRSLARIAGPESACLIAYLSAPILTTRLAALRGLGRLTDQPWTRLDQERRAYVQVGLKRHFKRKHLKFTERSATLIALARWGVTSEAKQLLAIHLRDGSLERLGSAALYAILVASPLTQRLQKLSDLLNATRPLTLTLAIARSLIDRRLKWSALKTEGQHARLKLLKRVIEQLPRRGDPRLVHNLQSEYLSLYRHLNALKPSGMGGVDHITDIVPPLSEEDD